MWSKQINTFLYHHRLVVDITYDNVDKNADGKIETDIEANDLLKVPVFSDNSEAVHEARSVWFNDGSKDETSGFYLFDGENILGPLGTYGA